MPREKVIPSTVPKALQEPIVLPPLKPGTPAEKSAQRRKDLGEAFLKRFEKINLLAAHYGLKAGSEGFWEILCLRMANDRFSGFKIIDSQRRGQKKLWDSQVLFLLWYDVQEKVKHGDSAHNSCRLLINKYPWSTLLKSSPSDATKQKALYEWYMKSKKSLWVKFIAGHKENPSIYEIREKVLSYIQDNHPALKKVTKK